MLNEVVQREPATSLDPELMGPLAAIGIVKGKPFAPDARMKKILTEALAVANATSRSLLMNPRERTGTTTRARPGRISCSSAAREFETPIPMITREGVKPFPPTGYRTLDARIGVLLRRHRHHARDGDAPARHRLAIPLRDGGFEQGVFRRREDVQGDAAEGHSGSQFLVVHALRQPDALDARHTATLSARRQPELPVARRRSRAPMAPRPFTSVRRSRQESNAATGSRRCPARAGSRSCASTARSNRSSTNPGGRVKSSWCDRLRWLCCRR